MSIEIKTRDLDELESMARAWLEKSCDAESIEERKQYDEELDQIIGSYNAECKIRAFGAARESGDPMKYACAEFDFPAIRVKETKDKDTKAIVREIDTNTRRAFDLLELDKAVDGGIGQDRGWKHTIFRLNEYLTKRAATRVGAEIEGTWVHKIDHAIELGQNPCSNTNLLKTTKLVIAAMIGEEYAGKVTSHDVNALVDTYMQDNRKSPNGFKLADDSAVTRTFKKMCHCILTGQKYAVVQRGLKAGN